MSNKTLKILNPIMFIVFLILIGAMILSKITHNYQLWGELHENAGIEFFVLVGIHFYLNWNWIKLNIFNIKPKATTKKK